jgi:hypothetical protein
MSAPQSDSLHKKSSKSITAFLLYVHTRYRNISQIPIKELYTAGVVLHNSHVPHKARDP